jgi:hypothetical protein
MARSRRGPALFEVIHRRSSAGRRRWTLSLPRWWRRGEAKTVTAEPDEPRAPEPPAASEPPLRADSAEQVAAAAPPPAPAVEEPPRVGEWSLRVQDGRVYVSLSAVACAVVIAALLVIVAGSFTLGRRAGLGDAQRMALAWAGDELGQAKQSAPNPSVLRGSPTGSAASHDRGSSAAPQVPVVEPDASSAGPLKPGKTYLVIQTFKRAARDDALRAQEFLAQKGVKTFLQSSSAGYRLIGLESFDYGDPADRARLEEFRQSVCRLGQVYASSKYRGGYDFQDCYPATFKS